MDRKRILVAPLNWGLGHATRCIPVIRQLEELGYEPVIASDGEAMAFLNMEFPHLRSYELPSYNIRYSSQAKFLKWKLMLRTPSFLQVMHKEMRTTGLLVQKENLSGIISDERPGVRHRRTPNVIMTHQLNVLSGITTGLTTSLHQLAIDRFDQCWVPDSPGPTNLSGILGHRKNNNKKIRYMGVLSRFRKQDVQPTYDITVLLSGPEPQRTLLEKKLLMAFEDTTLKILFIRGVINGVSLSTGNRHLCIKNFLTGQSLERAINASRLIISRSGYTTIMDLATLEKKAFFIPTPGQYEQEFLATRMKELGFADFCGQEDFHIGLLQAAMKKGPLKAPQFRSSLTGLFTLFEGK